MPFELTVVDIGGDDELEARYRVELSRWSRSTARRAFRYHVAEEDFRAALL